MKYEPTLKISSSADVDRGHQGCFAALGVIHGYLREHNIRIFKVWISWKIKLITFHASSLSGSARRQEGLTSHRHLLFFFSKQLCPRGRKVSDVNGIFCFPDNPASRILVSVPGSQHFRALGWVGFLCQDIAVNFNKM